MIKHNLSISIPCHWDKKVLKTVIGQKNIRTGNKVKEIYGALSGEILAHGRSNSLNKEITRDRTESFRELVRKKGLLFNYLINVPVSLKNKKKQVLEYLDWIINEFSADSITIASRELMQFVRQQYPKIPINVSTVGNVRTALDIKKVLKYYPRKIVLHHDANRSFSDLPLIVREAKKNGIIIEVLVTESCLRRCPFRDEHYKALGLKKDDSIFHYKCNLIKLTDLSELLNGNFIRPEDLEIYYNLGIRNIKISGRSKPASWLPEVTQAYINESYEGNLIRLLGISVPMAKKPWELIYLSNKSLDGFLRNYPKDPTKEKTYCNKWSVELFRNGALKISDQGSKYQILRNKMRYSRHGRLLKKIIHGLANER